MEDEAETVLVASSKQLVVLHRYNPAEKLTDVVGRKEGEAVVG